MNIINKIIAAIILTWSGVTLNAQQDPMYTHYMYNTLSVNPAYAGSRDALTVTGLHRSQWVGFKGAPITQTITLHAPLKNEHIGLGFSMMNDKIGPTNITSLIADYAFIMKLNKKSKLALGLSGGAKIYQANLSTLQLDQNEDPVFKNDIKNHTTPSFGFGAYYSKERFYSGVSSPNLLQNSYSEIIQPNGTILRGKEKRHFFFIAGSMIKLTEELELKPTTLVKVTQGAPIQADLTAALIIQKKLLVGAMFRTGDAFGALVGFNLSEQLYIGYSFDWSFGIKTFKYNDGSHELVVRYDFLTFNKKQIHTPRYF